MSAWAELLADERWCRGSGRFPLPAYSELMPPPWVGPKPYAGTLSGPPGPRPADGDDFGWVVTEYEEEQEIAPGLELIARGLLPELVRLGRGQQAAHLTRDKLRNNPYWPAALAKRAGDLPHERYVLLLSVALSRTQDDKGRVRWSLFGTSEQGPGKAFWRSFFVTPGREAPFEEAEGFFAELLSRCYGLEERDARDPGRAGVRVLPAGTDGPARLYDDGPLPGWAKELAWRPRQGLAGVRFLLTFRPFALLPPPIQDAYLAGELHLLPFPGSLAFWGVPLYHRLSRQLPTAMQLPLLSLFARRRAPDGMRFFQAGWLHEKAPTLEGEIDRPLFARTHRWQKVHRHLDDAHLAKMDSRVTQVLFSTDPDDIELYNKPMARMAQVWTRDGRLVLDGPRASERKIERAEERVAAGGTFGYRFVCPPMRVGPHEVYYHRPVVAFGGERPDVLPPGPMILLQAPAGYLTAYRAGKPDLARPVEFWPRWPDRPEHLAAVELFAHETEPRRGHTTGNVRALLEWSDLLGGERGLSQSLARALLDAPPTQSLESWLAKLPQRASNPAAGDDLARAMSERLADEADEVTEGLTFAATMTRDFEERYWRTIAELAHGAYRNKCTADPVRDAPTRQALLRRRRELDALARHLLRYHQREIGRSEAAEGGAWVGEHLFSWRTDFSYRWMGGWARNQEKRQQERNVLVRIPGRDSSRAVILADHYDTAYMHDQYYLSEGGTGARVAAQGADDNHSATAMLMLACPILLELSAAGRLGCDVWLVHLTGEEFPADCLGARALVQDLVQGTLEVREPDGTWRNLSGTRVAGVYVADMIAHNNDRNRNVFQISPGEDAQSARLAAVAHGANAAWNAEARALNRRSPRRGAPAYRRSDDPAKVPGLAPLAVLRGEVRPDWSPRSTLFNTDGQVFSDAGVPVVLFMEDYDIGRVGYHDSHDTMANIDLDYGAALAAIAIESAVRATLLG